MKLSQTVFAKQCIALLLLVMMCSSAFVQFNNLSDIQTHFTEEAIDLPDQKIAYDSVNGLSYFTLPQVNKGSTFIESIQLKTSPRFTGKLVLIYFEILVPPPQLV